MISGSFAMTALCESPPTFLSALADTYYKARDLPSIVPVQHRIGGCGFFCIKPAAQPFKPFFPEVVCQRPQYR
jgi:hypothetical protein